MSLLERISGHQAVLSVIGLGYVGLPLLVALAKAGFRVFGIDKDAAKVNSINAGRSYIGDISSEELSLYLDKSDSSHDGCGRLKATTDYAILDHCDVIFICVPTPFDEYKTPDLSYIIAASHGIAPHLHYGQLVVLQSTTFPGTTEEVVQPILEGRGLKAGVDFHLAFSPERIDPGNPQWTVGNTPKVVGGLTPACTELTAMLLTQINSSVTRVSSTRVAEMTKLLENIFRSVNIALVNELALLAERMGLDIWEVIHAASTKPFGFMPFYPGPGVGGHCIGVDPYYLSWKAREFDFYTKFIELAADTNQWMPYHVVELIAGGLSQHGHALAGANVLLLGVAFKPNVDDARNSPSERILQLLLRRGANVVYHDPHIPRFDVSPSVFHDGHRLLESVSLTDELLARQECVAILVKHSAVDYTRVLANAKLVVDCVAATRSLDCERSKVIQLGVGNPPILGVYAPAAQPAPRDAIVAVPQL